MSWSKSYGSVEQMEADEELPENATKEQFAAAKAAAKSIIDSGVIPALEKDEGHETHKDNPDGAPQGTLRVSFGGHAGRNPSLFVSVSGV